MASINTIVKRKQYLWLGIVVVGTRNEGKQGTWASACRLLVKRHRERRKRMRSR